MSRLRFDLYSGFEDDKSFTEHDTWVQLAGETVEELADRIRQAVIDNGEQLINDDDSEGEDE